MKSSGKRYVGDSIATFSPGDLCLFGPDVPHTFYNKHQPADREVHQIVVQFHEHCLGEGFFDRPQFSNIKALFERSLYGISFSGPERDAVEQKLKHMVAADDTEATASLISILGVLSRAANYQLLSRQKKMGSSIQRDTERMNRIYHYLLDNFRHDVSLEQIAAVANLSTAAFCRYFKQHTRKTLSEFVNELRISHACQLLKKKELSVLQVCYESGFNNISYFNRQFKQQMAVSPLQFQKKSWQYV